MAAHGANSSVWDRDRVWPQPRELEGTTLAVTIYLIR